MILTPFGTCMPCSSDIASFCRDCF